MNEKEIIRAFVEKQIYAIENIDGGCGPCIRAFCERMNELISEYGLELKVSGKYNNEVELIETK